MGVMIFEMLAGRRPFEASDKVALLRLHIDAPPPTLSFVSADAMATPQDLYHAADSALLLAKRSGRNRVAVNPTNTAG